MTDYTNKLVKDLKSKIYKITTSVKKEGEKTYQTTISGAMNVWLLMKKFMLEIIASIILLIIIGIIVYYIVLRKKYIPVTLNLDVDEMPSSQLNIKGLYRQSV
jgi:hypothetical protein